MTFFTELALKGSPVEYKSPLGSSNRELRLFHKNIMRNNATATITIMKAQKRYGFLVRQVTMPIHKPAYIVHKEKQLCLLEC